MQLRLNLNGDGLMIICVCTGASDRDVRRAVDAGAGSIAELSESCRAGDGCGSCHGMLREMLERGGCVECPRRRTVAAPVTELCAGN